MAQSTLTIDSSLVLEKEDNFVGRFGTEYLYNENLARPVMNP